MRVGGVGWPVSMYSWATLTAACWDCWRWWYVIASVCISGVGQAFTEVYNNLLRFTEIY